jgi:(2Fe-2S) ferredoxin
MSRLVSILIYSLTFSSFLLDSHALSLQNVKVQVCQNKDCCQRFRGTSQNLVQTIQHLCPEVQVESSACLSHCGKGPNICIQVNGEEHVHGEIVDAASAAAVLELETKVTIHPTLVAAVNVMERAYQGTSIVLIKRRASFYRVASKNIIAISLSVLLEAKSKMSRDSPRWNMYSCIRQSRRFQIYYNHIFLSKERV